jgi:amino acid permease
MAEEQKKGLRTRYFSKLEKGSLRGSILGMTCAAIGSGVLTFPSVFAKIGWVNGLLLLCMGAFGCWWSLYMLI